MAEIRLDRLHKRFGSFDAIHGIDLVINDGELAVLVGPSGCGKTTTLRMIAGLEDVSGGRILFDGNPVHDLDPKDRDIAMVFQSYALYPHMTVRGNLGFGLRMKGVPAAAREQAIQRAAKMLDIESLLERKPRQLSGGQRQRVAMGRALVRDPAAFLLDEPLSNLDAALRAQMRVEIKRIHQRLGATMVYVTHDQIEAMTLADRIVVMHGGRIEQVGSPQELYSRPVNRFVASFIGSPKMNLFPGTLAEEGDGLVANLDDGVQLKVPPARREAYRQHIGRRIEIGLRPEHLTDDIEAAGPGSQFFSTAVDVIEPIGATSLISFAMSGREYVAQGGPVVDARPGEQLRLQAAMDAMHLIDVDSGNVVPVPPEAIPQLPRRKPPTASAVNVKQSEEQG